MATNRKVDKPRLSRVLAVVRDGADAQTQDQCVLDWLRSDVEIDSLDVDSAVVAVAVASQLGDAERVGVAGAAQDKRVRKAARAASYKLRSAGVVAPERVAQTRWSLGAETRAVPAPWALLGLPEDDGYIPFLLASHGPDQACISGGVAGPGRGFRDDEHAHTSRSQARRIFHDARGDHRLRAVPFHQAVVLLEFVFDASAGRRPDGWRHLMSHVDAATMTAARQLDPFVGLAQTLDVDALHQVDSLLDGTWACAFVPDETVLSAYLERVMQIMARVVPDTDTDTAAAADSRAQLNELIDSAALRCIEGPGRLNWASAMNFVALFAAQSQDGSASAVARATSLALAEGRPGKDIPWVREWVSRQLYFATELGMRMAKSEAVTD